MRKILFVMNRILLVLLLVLCFSCNKQKSVDSDKFVRYSPKAVKLDRAIGGNAVVTAGIETYPSYVIPHKRDNHSTSEDGIHFWSDKSNKKPTIEQIQGVEEYEAHGCKIVLSDDFKQYTIEVEKDCEWDYLEVWTNWVDGYPVPSVFYIVLEPDLYDNF